MKRIKIILALAIFPLVCSAQFLSVGAQYADAKKEGNAIQFAANAAFPVWHNKNVLNAFLASGIDYTGGSSPVAGLNIKPIQLNCFLSEVLYSEYPLTMVIGCDAGYLFNHRHGKDGVIITPNIYLDYKLIFVKAGYDFNVTGNRKQFFVRAGVSLGLGSFKLLPNVKIW